MYTHQVHQQVKQWALNAKIDTGKKDIDFFTRLLANAENMHDLFHSLYGHRGDAGEWFGQLIQTTIKAYASRSSALRQLDDQKLQQDHWFLTNQLVGMSLYVDRFAGNLSKMPGKLDYLEELGVNFLHLMPIFESPANESDG